MHSYSIDQHETEDSQSLILCPFQSNECRLVSQNSYFDVRWKRQIPDFLWRHRVDTVHLIVIPKYINYR